MFFKQQINILCDAEDWSNDAENTEINYILTFIHITVILNYSNILYFFTVFLIK